MAAVERKELLALGAVVIGCLLPFVAKPFHIDDPMFVWTAERVLVAPLDFYGFEVNWHGFMEPNYVANKNPPLIEVPGWPARRCGRRLRLDRSAGCTSACCCRRSVRCSREPCTAIARRLDSEPVSRRRSRCSRCTARHAGVERPRLMSDVLMLALFVCGALLLLDARDSSATGYRLDSSSPPVLLAGLCPLAKYFGLALLPLLAAYGLARERRVGPWALHLLWPLLLFGAYELHMIRSYGHDPLGDVVGYAFSFESLGRLRQAAVGLSFAGGALLPVLFLAPWLWPRRALAAGATASVALVAAVALAGRPAELGLFVAAGGHLLLLAAYDVWRRRDAGGVLLLLWVAGTWVFCSFANWRLRNRSHPSDCRS